MVSFIVGVIVGFIAGVFIVALLGWINDVHEDKELAKLEKIKESKEVDKK